MKKTLTNKTTKNKRSPSLSGESGSSPKLLTGGNPQIPLGYGDGPVKTYIAAMPGWKNKVGETLDRLIERAIPNVSKAVKWNTPFYGFEGQGWFMAYSCTTKYVKVAFFQGASMDPLPPVESKQKHVRYFHIFEGDAMDELQFEKWIQQASRLPLEKM